METPATRLRCRDCSALFQDVGPDMVDVSVMVAWMTGLRCPSCGSAHVLHGQSRTLSEDAAFEWGSTEAERIARWFDDGEVGTSSMAMAEILSGRPQEHRASPSDLADFRRCVLLLERLPGWRPRLPEVAALGGQWPYFVAAWRTLEATFREEAGPDLARVPCPRTAALVAGCAGKGEVFLALAESAEALEDGARGA